MRRHFAIYSTFGAARRVLRRVGGRLSSGFLLCLAGVIAFGLLADEMAEGDTGWFDAVVRNGVNSFATPGLTWFAVFFSFVGDWPFLTALGIAIFVFLLYIKWKREAIIFLITNAGELILNVTLKEIYQRQRPEAFFGYDLPPSYSFPSGHALGSFCFLGILAWLLAANVEGTSRKLAIYIVSSLLILSIGLSRIYLGVHYPSDVLAGYLVASVWTLTVIFADRSLSRRREIQTG
ncbi:MAG TPA: phosphatase PAP2 family protein [Pyrinomonadaceae bacterium]|nr:phosphatase PAP2 family protein [Pyrinomonadaceae bacterium]